MKFFIAIIFSIISIVEVSAKDVLIQNSSIKSGFNSSIQKHLPNAIRCTNSLTRSEEFRKRLFDIYGSDSDKILKRLDGRSLHITFKPYYPVSRKTLASTNMAGEVSINNFKKDKTLSSMTATVAHETFHNLGFKHDDFSIVPDVTYTIGKIIEDLVMEEYCEVLESPTVVTKRSLIRRFLNKF